MQVFTIRIRETRVKRREIVAASADAARRIAHYGLGDGDEILDIGAGHAAPDEIQGRAALRHLLQTPFLGLDDGVDAQLGDWLSRAWAYPDNPSFERPLAMAGLRAYPDARLAIAIGSRCAPILERFDGTPWQGGAHGPALRSLPGAHAARYPLHFAGLTSRAVIVPQQIVEQEAST